MKRKVIILCAAFIVLMSAFISRKNAPSGIKGIISPPDAAKSVWAVKNRDSVSTAPAAGNFTLDLKPGKWKLHVTAIAPFKDAYVEEVLVEEGKYTDLGEIKLKGEIK